MGKIGHGYGSECHLLRFLGRHRRYLDREVLSLIGGDRIEWLDFHFDPESKWKDAERVGLDFIAEQRVQAAWAEFWPQTGRAQNWDAVGKVHDKGEESWLLVEAKANAEELESNCKAKANGRAQIEAALAQTKENLGVRPERDWLNGYYQLCNRIAVLHFLGVQHVAAHLLFVYFVGDSVPGRTCPQDIESWKPLLLAQEQHVALPADHPLAHRIHKLFLPVCPGPSLR